MARRNNIELSKELRLKTLAALLTGSELQTVAFNLNIKIKTLKARMTLLYKFYKVKSRLELMSLYINVPLEVRKAMREQNQPITRRKKYRTTEQYGLESKDDTILPFTSKIA